ncbi:PHD finger protein 11 isoform X2 [Moschus berezovskii]|uniref:PHD finger protein 11 isoform X2 n=1 Tax=Moschus berezovskii TaxID=68408 RepID=UPI002443986B|nr:PHD finger protein 11 isoform X2 [Moschus berezovskii]
MACGILVPQPGIESGPPAVEVWRLNHRTAREAPCDNGFLKITAVRIQTLRWRSRELLLEKTSAKPRYASRQGKSVISISPKRTSGGGDAARRHGSGGAFRARVNPRRRLVRGPGRAGHSPAPDRFPANGIEDGHTHSFSVFYISFFKKPAQSELKSSILNSVYRGRAGVFQVAERLQKRICALCPKDLECSVLYFAQSENIAAHENCLLYSSALVECEDHDPPNNDRNFDVESVKKEIKRGRKLKCTFCGKKGATVGCDLKSCFKNYHFFCAKNDHAVLQADGHTGSYKVFCQQHADPQNDLPSVKPLSGVFHSHYSEKTKPRHAYFSGVKRKRGRPKRLSTGNQDPNIQRPTKAAAAVQNAVQCCPVTCDEKKRAPIQTTLDRFFKRPPERMALKKEKDGKHTDAIVKAAFLKKCKEAGLLDVLFEEILDKLHLIQERLMDETTAESDYEEIGTLLFDCRLFEDTLVNFQAAIENQIHDSEEKRRKLKEEIELLQDLKQTLCSGLQSSSTSDSSLSS